MTNNGSEFDHVPCRFPYIIYSMGPALVVVLCSSESRYTALSTYQEALC